MLVLGHVAGDLLARPGVRPQVLRPPVGVAGDDGVRRVEDRLRRAVVLLQQHRGGVRVVALELQDVADRRTAEGVDGLVGVADDRQLGRLVRRVRLGLGEFPDEDVLGVVGVLVLVDQHVPEPAAVVIGHRREVLQQPHRGHDQVVEVQRVRLAQPPLVAGVDVGEHLLARGGRLVRPGLRRHELVLEIADLRGHRARRVALGVQIEFLEHQRHQPLGVVGVVDREGRLEVQVLGLGAQHPHAHRVERRDPHRLRPRPDQRRDALLHLARGLVGEGDGEDLPGRRAALGEQVGDAVGEHPGLARPGAGDDQQRPALVHDRGALLRVQTLEQALGRRLGRRVGEESGLVHLGARVRRVADIIRHATGFRTYHQGYIAAQSTR